MLVRVSILLIMGYTLVGTRVSQGTEVHDTKRTIQTDDVNEGEELVKEPPNKDPIDEPLCVGAQAPSGLPIGGPSPVLPPNQVPSPEPVVSHQISMSSGVHVPAMGDPGTVRLGNGQLTWNESILSLSGAGVDYLVQLRYRSRGSTTDIGFGHGWHSNIFYWLDIQPDGQGQPLSLTLYAGGHIVEGTYEKTADPGSWFKKDGTADPTVIHYDPTTGIATRFHPSGHREIYTNLDGGNSRLRYLTRFEDQFNNALTYAYRTNVPGSFNTQALDAITDSIGRRLQVGYDPVHNGHIASLSLTAADNTPLGQVDFAYEMVQPIQGVELFELKSITHLEVPTRNAAGQLEMVRPTRQYEYDAPIIDTMNQHGSRLIKVYSANPGNPTPAVLHEWRYASSGPSDYNYEVRQQVNNPGTAYEGIHSFVKEGTKTTHTDPDGNVTVYQHDSRGRVLQTKQRMSAAPENRWSVATVAYDDDCSCGRIKSVTNPNGMVETRYYDDAGNVNEIWHESNGLKRVSRVRHRQFDPIQGQFFAGITHQHPMRNAHANEIPGACGDDVQCWADKRIIRTTYNDQGLIERVTYPPIDGTLGSDAQPKSLYEESYEYYSSGRLKTRSELINGQEVSRTEFTLTTDNLVKTVTVTDPINNQSWTTVHLERDAWRRITKSMNHTDVITLLRMSQSGHVYETHTDWRDQLGRGKNTTQWFYDLAGNLVHQIHSSDDGLAIATTNERRAGDGLVTKSTTTYLDGSTRSWTYGYDLSGMRLWSEDYRGIREGIVLGFGALRKPVEAYMSHNGVRKTQWQAIDYNEAGQLLESQDAARVLSRMTYDGFGRPSESVAQSAFDSSNGEYIWQRTRVSYDHKGFVSQVDSGALRGDPNSPTETRDWFTTKFLRNYTGHALGTEVYVPGQSAPIRKSQIELDGRAHIVASESYFGDPKDGPIEQAHLSRAEVAYNAIGQPLRTTHYLPGTDRVVTQFEYYPKEDRQVVTTSDGSRLHKAETRYDRDERRSDSTVYEEGLGPDAIVSSAYGDGFGRTVATVDPIGRRKEFTYTAKGDQIETERIVRDDTGDDHVTTYEYDDSIGLLTKLIDAQGKETLYTYNDTCGGTYDCFLMPRGTHYMDGRYEEIIAYNLYGQPIGTLDSRGLVHTYSYDLAGNLTRDEANSASVPSVYGHKAMIWEYDVWRNQLVSSETIDHSDETVWQTTYEYNDRGQRTRETQAAHYPPWSHSWQWPEYGYGGELLKELTPTETDFGLSGRTWHYDSTGRLDQVKYYDSAQQLLASYQMNYDGGRLASRQETLNNTSTSYGFDNFGRLDDLHHLAGSDTIFREQRIYDKAGQTVLRQESDTGGHVYLHDRAGRLTAAIDVPHALNLTPETVPASYDSAEWYDLNKMYTRNRVVIEDSSGTTIEDYVSDDVHFYEQVGQEVRTQEHGNLSEDGDFIYHWDAWNRLFEVRRKSGSPLLRFTYDTQTRRVVTEDLEDNSIERIIYLGWDVAGIITE